MSSTIRFPLARDRKRNQVCPATAGFHGSEFCTRQQVCIAIGYRHDWRDALEKSQRLAEIGDARGARVAHFAAVRAREQMRSMSLWARIFADQIRDNDPRLAELSQKSYATLSASFRASNLNDRWRRVQLLKFAPKQPDTIRDRINRVLDRIAAKHDELNPYGYTLPRASA